MQTVQCNLKRLFDKYGRVFYREEQSLLKFITKENLCKKKLIEIKYFAWMACRKRKTTQMGRGARERERGKTLNSSFSFQFFPFEGWTKASLIGWFWSRRLGRMNQLVTCLLKNLNAIKSNFLPLLKSTRISFRLTCVLNSHNQNKTYQKGSNS